MLKTPRVCLENTTWFSPWSITYKKVEKHVLRQKTTTWFSFFTYFEPLKVEFPDAVVQAVVFLRQPKGNFVQVENFCDHVPKGLFHLWDHTKRHFKDNFKTREKTSQKTIGKTFQDVPKGLFDLRDQRKLMIVHINLPDMQISTP